MTQEKKTKTVALTVPFGQVYVKTMPNGQIMRPIQGRIKLSESKGHIYEVKGKMALTALGYIQANKVASINLVTPNTVSVDGKRCPNPHVERDPETKAIETVNLHKVGIGYGPMGNVVIVDRTLYYNIHTYFIQSIQSKMKKQGWKWDKDQKKNVPTGKLEHPNCAVLGTADKEPNREGSWAFYPTAPPLGLWCNYEDPAFLECLEEHTQRQRFGDRIAQTIITRNILKDHPAIGIGQVEVIGEKKKRTTEITVWGYRHDHDTTEINDLAVQAETGIIKADAKVIDVKPEEEKEAKSDVETEEKPTGSPAKEEEPPDSHYDKEKNG